MIDNYLQILEESLQKKSNILDGIAQLCGEQEELLKKDPFSFDEFDKLVDQKDEAISKINQLDEGFEALYERIKAQLMGNKAQYADQIGRLQTLIAQVTDKSVSIQAREARNKQMIETHFTKERNRLKGNKRANKAAYGYYKSMSNPGGNSSQFLDQKK